MNNIYNFKKDEFDVIVHDNFEFSYESKKLTSVNTLYNNIYNNKIHSWCYQNYKDIVIVITATLSHDINGNGYWVGNINIFNNAKSNEDHNPIYANDNFDSSILKESCYKNIMYNEFNKWFKPIMPEINSPGINGNNPNRISYLTQREILRTIVENFDEIIKL